VLNPDLVADEVDVDDRAVDALDTVPADVQQLEMVACRILDQLRIDLAVLGLVPGVFREDLKMLGAPLLRLGAATAFFLPTALMSRAVVEEPLARQKELVAQSYQKFRLVRFRMKAGGEITPFRPPIHDRLVLRRIHVLCAYWHVQAVDRTLLQELQDISSDLRSRSAKPTAHTGVGLSADEECVEIAASQVCLPVIAVHCTWDRLVHGAWERLASAVRK
jgi:hypothetical protein